MTGVGKGFGAWSAGAINTSVLAATDGFVVCSSGILTNGGVVGYSDASTPPTTIRAQVSFGFGSSGRASFTMPVRKGDYWKVSAGCTTNYWIPLN